MVDGGGCFLCSGMVSMDVHTEILGIKNGASWQVLAFWSA